MDDYCTWAGSKAATDEVLAAELRVSAYVDAGPLCFHLIKGEKARAVSSYTMLARMDKYE